MKSALEIFVEIVLALFGTVFFAALIVGASAFGLGCLVFGSCYGFLGWRRRRASRLKKRSPPPAQPGDPP
jgi:hypothetical protein